MANFIPFIPSSTNYTLNVAFGDIVYAFFVRWNDRDAAWYMDMFGSDGALIQAGIKIVLGVNLGRLNGDAFFVNNHLRVSDTSGKGIDAAYDELGTRKQVVCTTADDTR